MYRTFNINAHARSTLQNLNRLCGTCKINPINIAWEFKKKIDTMFKDAFDSLCFYSDLTKTTKLVIFFIVKKKIMIQDLCFVLFRKLKKTFMCFSFHFQY